MSAKGAQSVRAHENPTIPTSVVAAPTEEMKNVASMQSAKLMCERSQARRRVSHGI